VRIFVSGGSGFIGSHSVVALLRAGHQVRLLIRNPDKMRKVFDLHGITIDEYVEGDITDAPLIRETMIGCDAVLHSAGMVSTSKKMEDKVRETNVGGTENVVGQAAGLGIKHIVHVSSITAMHDPRRKTINEMSSPGKAENAYSRSKVESEYYVRGLQAAGAPVTISYPTGVIGPLDPGISEPMEGLAMLLKTVAALNDSGVQFVDVRDCARAHLHILEGNNEYNRFIIAGHYITWRELVKSLESITGNSMRKMDVHPAVLRFIGLVMDLIHKITDKKMYLSHEAAVYSTQWCFAESQRLQEKFGFEFRDPNESITDSLLDLGRTGQLTPKLLGKLATSNPAQADTGQEGRVF
jgi:nucleoside-diphosphate-sugar epimerase